MAWSSACAVFATSPMIQRLTGSVALGGTGDALAPMPFDCANRAAFHSLVPKLR